MIFYNFDQVGKGINPNEPKKEGLALYFDVIYREFWGILYLNILFFIACLPIVTIGAAYGALCSVFIRMIRDVPVDTFYDFKTAFKKNFKQSTLIFLIQGLTLILIAIAFEFYIRVNPFFHIPLGVACVLFGLMNMYLVPIAVSVDVPFGNIFKNSFFLLFLSLKMTILCGILNFLHLAMGTIMFPYSLSYFLLGGFIFLTFTTCFMTYLGISKYCYNKPEGDSTDDETPPELSHSDEMAQLEQELQELQKLDNPSEDITT